MVISEAAQRLSGIHTPQPSLWFSGSRASLAPRNDNPIVE